jgi:CRISPR-associated protein Csm3
MQLTKIIAIKAELVLLTGLHIGAGDGMMHIGGVDSPVIRHPITQEPYIPGSSLKGKMRSLLEWRSGAVQENPLGWKDKDKTGVMPILQPCFCCNFPHCSDKDKTGVMPILQLFGISGDANLSADQAELVGHARLSFWDCPLDADWVKDVREDNLPLTEIKSENSINRISGTATNPRQTERVPAGAKFTFRLSFKCLSEKDEQSLIPIVLDGLKLLEMDSLGGSGSRGYGKVKFKNLKIDGEDKSARFDAIQPFTAQA